MTQNMDPQPRRTRLLIAALVTLALVGGFGALGVRYYQARYTTTEYYAQVPADYPMIPVTIRDMRGTPVGTGYQYQLEAFDAAGSGQKVEFTVDAPGTDIYRGETPPEPGQYLLVQASSQLVNAWQVIDVSKIPPAALTALGALA